ASSAAAQSGTAAEPRSGEGRAASSAAAQSGTAAEPRNRDTDDPLGPLPPSAAPWPPVPSSSVLPSDSARTGALPSDDPPAGPGPDGVRWIPEDPGLTPGAPRPWTEPAMPWQHGASRPSQWPVMGSSPAAWPPAPVSPPPPSVDDLFGPPLA